MINGHTFYRQQHAQPAAQPTMYSVNALKVYKCPL